ncbi:MAG: membrane protein insertase YidC [Fusobacteriaceae bacterium]|nr:membrane protein insertase YidC [Fusobacteriaceae bacterium]MBN2837628.1 membrane protein insertase YidC [Fusobacteriaceae bacterium]
MALNKINGSVGNFTLSIVLLTIVVKLLLLPLTLKQDKSMRAMKDLQPEMEEIKKKFPNKQDQQMKMAELYKEKKINPVAGCLPLLIQMPILIALYRVFQNPNNIPSGAHFLMWELSKPDPAFIKVLPLLNGVLTFLQQKLMSTGNTDDNPMAKQMLIMMPIMLTFISWKMPVGLLIYWVSSSAISIIQQQLIMRLGDKKNVR